ncbi:MAG: hypothetical protein ACXQTR_06290 [Candidatus Methanospirareceae archaeon]
MPTKSRILLYQTEDGRQRVEVRLENETVWLSQRLLAELFQKDVRTINEHIKNRHCLNIQFVDKKSHHRLPLRLSLHSG